MESIFADDWRECLIAHYTYVQRENDRRTERSLRGVLLNAGFTEEDLRRFTIQATAHVDDVGADFVPDPALLEAEATFAIAVPQEVIEAQLVEESLALDEQADAEALEDSSEESEVVEANPDIDDAPPPNPDITQLSLF